MRRVGASRIERGEYTMPRALRRGLAARRRQEREPGLRPVSYLVYLPKFVFGGCAVPHGVTSEDGRACAMSQVSGSVCQPESSQLGAGRAAEPQLGGAPRGKE